MRVSVFGLGHTGTVTAACAARSGHEVVGVDPATERIASVNRGESPVREPGLGALVAEGVRAARLRATSSPHEGVHGSDVAIVCVGTPGSGDGSPDFGYLTQSCEDIGSALRSRPGEYTVVIRSTVLPGTTESLVIPILEARSGRQLGRDLSVSVMPEFLREGSAITDFSHPARIIVGAHDERGYATALAVSCVETAPVLRVAIGVAELVKYVDNAWHALKVAFANEIGTIAQEHQVDGQEVMELFCRDDKLNLAPSYLMPGAPFGGSCLPKDVRALTRRAQEKKLDVPLLDAIMASNDRHLDRIFDSVVGYGSKRVGVLGLAFKENTGDLRESPMVTLVHRLLNMGFEVRVHEPQLSAVSATRGPGEQPFGLPIDRPEFLTANVDDLIDHAQTLIIGTGWTMTDGLARRLRSSGLTVVNLAGPQRSP